jgi:chromosomal replication initiator protein
MTSQEEIWGGVLGELEVNLSRPNFNTWFKDTYILSIKDDKKVIVGVPNTFTLEWLQNKYSDEIKKALQKFLPNVDNIDFQVAHPERILTRINQREETKDMGLVHFEMPKPQTLQKTKNLNSYFTFENFIVGDSNKFAHAAALAVAKNPGKNYNPLFIYGGVGLGKTHLIHAIAWEVKKQTPHQKILYLSFEEFASDFINFVQQGKMEQFKKKYREVDLLLIDDIQFISGKERTQDEFFHTFNILHQAQKQIVITSDRPPKSIPLLEERLRSRFEWGMIVDVGAPDLETRIAILKQKLMEKNLKIDDEILDFIAHQVQHNIRELEGALNKIEAYLDFTGEELTINQVKKLLESLIKSKKNIDPKKILNTVCEYYQVEKKDVLGQKREQKITLPRQIIMYFLRYEFNFSFPKIAEFLNRKDHTTIIYGCGKVEKEITNNSLLKRDIDAIKQRLIVY